MIDCRLQIYGSRLDYIAVHSYSNVAYDFNAQYWWCGTLSKQRKYPKLKNTSVYLFSLSGKYIYICRLAQDITILIVIFNHFSPAKTTFFKTITVGAICSPLTIHILNELHSSSHASFISLVNCLHAPKWTFIKKCPSFKIFFVLLHMTHGPVP